MGWLFNDESDRYECDVRLVPMCSCGYVFTGGIPINNADYYDDQRFVHRMNYCPSCGRRIGVIKQGKIDSAIAFEREKDIEHEI